MADGIQNRPPLTGPIQGLPLPFPAPPANTAPVAPNLLGDQLRLGNRPLTGPVAPVQPVNQPVVQPLTAPLPPPGYVPAPAPTANPAPIANGPASQEIAQLRQALQRVDAVTAMPAIYRLQELAATNRAEVLQVLSGLISMPNPDVRALAAIDVLDQLNAREVVPQLQSLRYTENAMIRQAATTLLAKLNPPAPRPVTPAPGPAANPQQPAAPVQPAPVQQGNPAALAIIGRLMDFRTTDAASVELSRLPTADLVLVASRLIDTPGLRNTTLDMVTAALVMRSREPGVAELLCKVAVKDAGYNAAATSRAALALTGMKNPAYLPTILTFLASRRGYIGETKRAIVEMLATGDPEVLKNPVTIKVLRAIMKEEFADRHLVFAASYALGESRSPEARAALGASSLLKEDTTEYLVRVLTDLDKHPAPYSEETVDRLRVLSDKDSRATKQVQDLAKKLLAKR